MSTYRSDTSSIEDIRQLMGFRRGGDFPELSDGFTLSGLERLLIQLVDCQPDATYAIDTEGRVIAWNRAMEDLTGVCTSEILGKAGYEYAVPFFGDRRPVLIDYVVSRDDEILNLYTSVASDRDAFFAELEVLLKSHGQSVLWVKAQPLYDFSGNIIGAIESLKDITAYKNIQNELKDVEGRYRALFDRSLFFVYVHDFDGNYLDANKATLDTLGYTLQELTQCNFMSLITEDQYPLAAKIRDEILKNGTQNGVSEFTITRKDSTRITIESNGALIFCDGKPYAIQGVARDITDQKLAEEALRESENRYRTVFENVSDSLIIHELDGTIIETNMASVRRIGYTADALKGMNIRDLIPEKYRDGFDEYLHRIIENGRDDGLLRVRTKEGDDRVVEYRNVLIRHPDGTPSYIQGSARDITEQIKAQKALKESTDKYRNIVENMQEGYFEVDLSGSFTFFNHVICDNLGYTEDELSGMNYLDYMDEENARKVFERFHQVFQTGKSIKAFEWEQIRKNGSPMFVEASIMLIRNARGEPVGFQGIVRDITERKEAEQERVRQEMRFIQAQKMETIGALASGIAHDFNNILSGILGFSELLRHDLPEGSRSTAYCEQITGAGMRARDLVQQILSFSRSYKAHREPICVYPVVEEALKLLRATIPTTIEINSFIDKVSGVVYCDATEIHQIVMNLCTNAFHSMEETGGILGVCLCETVLEADFTARYPSLEPGPHVVLSVSDTGCGMDDETRKHIFEPFFTTKEQGKGTGLGLATVQRIASSLNGEIILESAPNRGSTFTIYLPCIKKERE
ncbi:MAG: PAS domain S-box protein [Desulfomonilia bacterium]